MKKLLMIAALLAVGLAGCKDDDEKNDLVGTSWENSDGNTVTLQFTSGNVVTLSAISDDDGVTLIVIPGTYVYNPPDITIILRPSTFEMRRLLGVEEDVTEETKTGTVSGNKMSFPEPGYDTVVFTKTK